MIFACQFCGGELEVIVPAILGGGGLAFLFSCWNWLKSKFKKRKVENESVHTD